MIGQEIGRYRLDEEIGRGAFSVVYKAKDPGDDKPVAIKFLQIEGLDHDAIRQIIEPEISVIASAKPRLLVPLYSIDEHEGRTYLVMRYMAGGNLADRLAKGPLSFDEAYGLLSVLAPIFDYIEKTGCIHGDIKPQNILFDSHGLPFLGDYGMFKIASAAVKSDTSSKLAGPAVYSSPEQLLGDRPLDIRSDIYMLGVVLYEMLVGKPPFAEAQPLELIARKLVSPPGLLSTLRTDIPAGVDAIIQRTLEREPGLRYKTVSEMLEALGNADQAPAPAVPPELPLPVPEGERPEPNYVNLENLKARKSRRFRPGCFLFAWLLIGLLAFLATSEFSLLIRTPYKGFLDPLFATPVVQTQPTATQTLIPPTWTPTVTITPSPTLTMLPTSAPSLEQPTSEPALVVKSGIVEKASLPATDYFVDQLVTCFDVAGQYDVSYQKLVDANPLVDCKAILRQGIRIKIPAQEAYTYTLSSPPVDPIGIAQLKQMIVLDETGEPRAVDFSDQGDLLAVASGKDVYIWRVGEWKPYRQLRGHLAQVNDVVFSPNGLLLASVSNDTSVRVWDVTTGKTVQTFYGHSKPVTAVAFAKDNINLVSVSLDGSLRYWNVASGIGSIGRLDPAYSVAYSPDGNYLAVGMEDKVRIYPAGRIDWLFDLNTQGIVRSLAFSSDNELLATNQDIWQVRLKKELYKLSYKPDAAVFTSDNQSLVFGQDVFMVANGEKISTVNVPIDNNDRLDMDIQKSGGLIVMAGKKGVSIWGFPASYTRARIPETQLYTVKDNDTLFNIAYDNQVRVSSLMMLNNLTCGDPIFPSQQLLIPLNDSAKIISNPQGMDAITADNLARIQEYQSFEMTCVKTLSELVFSPNSQMLIGGSALWQNDNGAVRVEAPDVPRLLDGNPDQNLVSSILVISPDNRTVAVRDGNLVEIWDAQTGRILKTFTNHQDQVTSLVFSPDGSLLASAGSLNDAKIRVWNLAGNDPIQPLENLIASEIFFTADGKALIIATAESVHYWQIGSVESEQLVSLDGPITMAPDRTRFAFIRCLSFSGRTCLSSAAVSYDINTRKETRLIAFRDKVQTLAYSQDGLLLAGGTENNISIWDLTTNSVVQTLRITDSRADIVSLNFSNDANFIAAVDARGVMRIWHVFNATILFSSTEAGLQPVARVAFSPDSRVLAFQEGETIHLFGVPH